MYLLHTNYVKGAMQRDFLRFDFSVTQNSKNLADFFSSFYQQRMPEYYIKTTVKENYFKW